MQPFKIDFVYAIRLKDASHFVIILIDPMGEARYGWSWTGLNVGPLPAL